MSAKAVLSLAPFDRELATWQGRIAVAKDLNTYHAALLWAKQDVPPDRGLCEKAKQEIRETAERHLADVHGADVLDAIYFSVFPDETTINADLDADINNRDQSAERDAEIKRLAKLSAIEYEHERKAAAEKLGIGRVTVLDKLVNAIQAENRKYKGTRPPLGFAANSTVAQSGKRR